jgi:serine/threonine-protein kinase/endoribonuclease IRE1
VIFTTCIAETISLRRDRDLASVFAPDRREVDSLRFLSPPASASSADGTTDSLEPLNVVLVASVDGKFHALSRATGEKLWSMPSTSTYASSEAAGGTARAFPTASLQPLVTTQHPDFDGDDDSGSQETYIIEPQSGDIYVTSSPSAPLQRLPFSMPQLVDMSPFSFGDTDRRVFVGKKKTSLLVVELETGRVKAALDAECPWDPFDDMSEQDSYDIDLDELDGTKPHTDYPTDIYIGRTGMW